MQVDKVQLDLESETLNANMIKDITLNRLVVDKLITQEVVDDFKAKTQIIVIKHSWFKSWVKKYINKEHESSWGYKIVKFED